MATVTKVLPPSGRKSVAIQVGSYLQSLHQFNRHGSSTAKAAPKAAPKSKLDDDFPYRTVLLDSVLTPPADLKELIESTELWLHLISSGGATTHYALSQSGPFAKSAPTVLAVIGGPLASKVAKTAQWIDENDQDDAAKTCILGFPSFSTYAFGILRGGKSYAVLIAQPDENKKLKFEKEYPLKEFLAKLAQEPNTSGVLAKSQ